MRLRGGSVRGRLVAGMAGMVALGSVCSAGAVQASEVAQTSALTGTAVSWTPNLIPSTEVPHPVAWSITTAGDQMVVGGRFTAIADARHHKIEIPRTNVAAFSATTGAINANFAPQVDGDVRYVLSDGTSVFLGGSFKNVNGVSRPALAKLDLATGQLDPAFRPPIKVGRVSDMEFNRGRLVVSGTFGSKLLALDPTTGHDTHYITSKISGQLPKSDAAQVFKFDISPDGSRLVAVGNFTTVDGQDRPRMFMLNLDDTSATLSDWHYWALSYNCTSTRVNAQAYVQDVDFAPDSSYFAVAAFGYMFQKSMKGYQLCDSVSRFETNDLAPTRPTWINYTGGDSLKSVAATGAAVYVQGHSRWLDNPDGQDSAGRGAVDRLGGGAVDPNTGKALPWNPVMPQQAGGYQILPTDSGVWFATDGRTFGGKLHRGIRFVPLP